MKELFKKWWFWLIIIVLIIFVYFIGGFIFKIYSINKELSVGLDSLEVN